MKTQESAKKFKTSPQAVQSGKIIVIVAPSGTGKSTLIQRLRKDFPDLKESVSFTTRPKRPGEVDGRNYFFIAESEFIEKIKANDFIEWAKVHSNYYGTSKSFVEQSLSEGHSLLFDLDVQGADSFKKCFGPRANVIFIEPPSVEELGRRLHDRGTETEEKIRERLANAQKELLRKNDFDELVMNDHFESAYKRLQDIFHRLLAGEA